LLFLAAACVAYYFAVGAGLKLQVGFSKIAVLRPANSVLTAVLALTPVWHWWRYLLAVIPVHLAAHTPQPVGIGWSAVQIPHNSAMAVGVTAALRKFASAPPSFDRVKETTVFLAAAMLAAWLAAVATVGIPTVISPEAALLRHGWPSGWWNTTRQIGLCDTGISLGDSARTIG
jgi:hypothetical protein